MIVSSPIPHQISHCPGIKDKCASYERRMKCTKHHETLASSFCRAFLDVASLLMALPGRLCSRRKRFCPRKESGTNIAHHGHLGLSVSLKVGFPQLPFCRERNAARDGEILSHEIHSVQSFLRKLFTSAIFIGLIFFLIFLQR